MSDIKKVNERLSKKSENFSLHEIISRNKIITIHFSEVQIIQIKEGDEHEGLPGSAQGFRYVLLLNGVFYFSKLYSSPLQQLLVCLLYFLPFMFS